MSFYTRCLKTHKILMERKPDNFKDIALDIKSLYQGHKILKAKTIEERVSLVEKIKENLIENKEIIKKSLNEDMGKRLNEAEGEVNTSIKYIETFLDALPKLMHLNPIHKKNYKITSNLEPLGVIFKIVPFNYPLYLPLKMVIPNILIGNTVIIRPNESCLKIGELYNEIFGNEDFIKTTYSDVKDTELILSMNEIAGVSFTGSTNTGRVIGGLAGKYLKKSVLELGGSDAFVVSDNCDLDYVVKTVFERRLTNVGQICNSPKRILVHKNIFDSFKEKLIYEIEKFDIFDYPYMSSQKIFEQICEQTKTSLKKGDKLLTGNLEENIKDKKFYPILIQPKNEDSILMQEEIFGPLFVIYPFEDEEDAITIINNNKFGLGCSIFDKDVKKAEKFSKLIESGQVFINSCTVSNPVLPWGGIKHSGYGRDCGRFGLEAFSVLKTVIKKI